jgi:hypothetical protein
MRELLQDTQQTKLGLRKLRQTGIETNSINEKRTPVKSAARISK